MGIRDWPEQERPREKLLAQGAQALSDAELLALFLGSGTRGCNAIDLGRQLLNRPGGLRALLRKPCRELVREPGLGLARASRLLAALELATRYLASHLEQPGAMNDPRHAASYFQARLRDHSREVFACLFLDAQLRPLGTEELFWGTLDAASVYPREVVKRALAHNAAAVILAHNHPSGVAEPSRDDREITHCLSQALALVGVRVIDHFVVGEQHVTSFAERGWL